MEKNQKKLSNKELLRLIVDELAGVIVTDINGRYVYVPSNAAHLMESLDFFLKQLEHNNAKCFINPI